MAVLVEGGDGVGQREERRWEGEGGRRRRPAAAAACGVAQRGRRYRGGWGRGWRRGFGGVEAVSGGGAARRGLPGAEGPGGSQAENAQA